MSIHKDMSPAALAAALRDGTEGWGTWGSAAHHVMYVEPIGAKTRRHCRCGCRRVITHRACANGVALYTGCELEVRRFAKEVALRRMER